MQTKKLELISTYLYLYLLYALSCFPILISTSHFIHLPATHSPPPYTHKT